MELKSFLKEAGSPQINFAREINISKNYLSEIINKKRRPSPNLALRISDATHGRVSIMELLYPKNNMEKAA
jgi:plasmid maintenance system antidote protein VapI